MGAPGLGSLKGVRRGLKLVKYCKICRTYIADSKIVKKENERLLLKCRSPKNLKNSFYKMQNKVLKLMNNYKNYQKMSFACKM